MLATQARKLHWAWLVCGLLSILFMGVSCANSAPNAATATLYGDSLAIGWEDWSWDSVRDFAAIAQVHSGSASIAITPGAAWSGFSVRNATPLAASGYTSLDFWIYGNGAPVSVSIQATDQGNAGDQYTFTPTAGEWTEVIIPLTALGSPAQIARINWQNQSDVAQGVYYLDDIRLIGDGSQPPPPNAITLRVDVNAARKPISPYIYGMNQYGTRDSEAALLQELAVPVRRWGGNATSRYNYQTDISNHAADWFFNNLKQSDATELPNDSAVNRFITTNRKGGADSFIVLPLSGYVSNDNGLACGFSVTQYGPQKATAAGDGRPDCGNGVRLNGDLITGNDPLATSIAVDEQFVAGWVDFLVSRFGAAGMGGVRFYNYDNEPDLWFTTHRDVRPVGYKYDEIRDLTYLYGAAIKAADPGALLLGPAVHGWTYYWHSAYDGQRTDWATPDDRNAHGGTPFIAWYLQQMRAYEEANGVRILDYLDLHYYPADGIALVPAGDAATQTRRLRSTRSLWDPTYVDESWIAGAGPDGGIVRLIPRMREWVAQNYPDTKLAIGEYNWGGQEHINGALAQADVLGIFGREGVDLATLWQPPQLDQPGAYAFRIYRNYDGAGAKFGDTSIAATSSDQSLLSIYAAQRSDNAVTLVIINKSGSDQSALLTVDNFGVGGPAQLYRYSAANLNAIVRGADVTLTNNQLTLTYPANSITLLVIPAGTTEPPPPAFSTRLRLPFLTD